MQCTPRTIQPSDCTLHHKIGVPRYFELTFLTKFLFDVLRSVSTSFENRKLFYPDFVCRFPQRRNSEFSRNNGHTSKICGLRQKKMYNDFFARNHIVVTP